MAHMPAGYTRRCAAPSNSVNARTPHVLLCEAGSGRPPKRNAPVHRPRPHTRSLPVTIPRRSRSFLDPRLSTGSTKPVMRCWRGTEPSSKPPPIWSAVTNPISRSTKPWARPAWPSCAQQLPPFPRTSPYFWMPSAATSVQPLRPTRAPASKISVSMPSRSAPTWAS